MISRDVKICQHPYTATYTGHPKLSKWLKESLSGFWSNDATTSFRLFVYWWRPDQMRERLSVDNQPLCMKLSVDKQSLGFRWRLWRIDGHRCQVCHERMMYQDFPTSTNVDLGLNMGSSINQARSWSVLIHHGIVRGPATGHIHHDCPQQMPLMSRQISDAIYSHIITTKQWQWLWQDGMAANGVHHWLGQQHQRRLSQGSALVGVHEYWQFAKGFPVEGHAPLTMIKLLRGAGDGSMTNPSIPWTPVRGESILQQAGPDGKLI